MSDEQFRKLQRRVEQGDLQATSELEALLERLQHPCVVWTRKVDEAPGLENCSGKNVAIGFCSICGLASCSWDTMNCTGCGNLVCDLDYAWGDYLGRPDNEVYCDTCVVRLQGLQ